MKVKITVTGMLDLEKLDVKLLKNASPIEVMDTLKQLAPKLTIKVETAADAKECQKGDQRS